MTSFDTRRCSTVVSGVSLTPVPPSPGRLNPAGGTIAGQRAVDDGRLARLSPPTKAIAGASPRLSTSGTGSARVSRPRADGNLVSGPGKAGAQPQAQRGYHTIVSSVRPDGIFRYAVVLPHRQHRGHAYVE